MEYHRQDRRHSVVIESTKKQSLHRRETSLNEFLEESSNRCDSNSDEISTFDLCLNENDSLSLLRYSNRHHWTN